MHIYSKPPVHLWIFNHPFFYISDQVDFFVSLLQQYGYPVSIGREPAESCLNVAIENFSSVSRETFVEFCRATGKRVAVIMTEHLNLVDGQLMIHGDQLGHQSNQNDYIHPDTLVRRVKHLFECIPYIRALFVLGDLPKLKNVHAMLPGLDVRWFPFPKIVEPPPTDRDDSPDWEFSFAGSPTKFREAVITMLKDNGFNVLYPDKMVSRNRRNALNRNARLVLNLPQRNSWQWLSLMRVIATLRCGRATVSLATQDDSEIAACTYQVGMNDDKWQHTLRDYLGDWQILYHQALDNYRKMAEVFSKIHPFPHDLLELWAITDRLKRHKA